MGFVIVQFVQFCLRPFGPDRVNDRKRNRSLAMQMAERPKSPCRMMLHSSPNVDGVSHHVMCLMVTIGRNRKGRMRLDGGRRRWHTSRQLRHQAMLRRPVRLSRYTEVLVRSDWRRHHTADRHHLRKGGLLRGLRCQMAAVDHRHGRVMNLLYKDWRWLHALSGQQGLVLQESLDNSGSGGEVWRGVLSKQSLRRLGQDVRQVHDHIGIVPGCPLS